MKNFICIFFIAVFVFVSRCYAEGLSTLIEVGKAQSDIQKSYSEETDIYNGVKRAVENGSIKKGQKNSEIESKYGKPVVAVRDYDTGRDKWVYKPAKSTFDQGEKIALFFDKNGILEEIKISN